MANHRGGSGNFAEDRERASEAGKKGGQHSGGNFKNDPQRASEAGKKGGKSSHGKSDKLAGLISDECIFVCSSSKSHHRRLPGG